MDAPAHSAEITSLNADDLSVEELEQRLEMMLAAPSAGDSCACYRCDQLGGCASLQCNAFWNDGG